MGIVNKIVEFLSNIKRDDFFMYTDHLKTSNFFYILLFWYYF